MGTSKQLPTPAGGPWTPVKNGISDYLGGNRNVTPQQLVGGTIRALGGLNVPSPGRATGGGSTGGGGGGGRSSVGRATSRLGGFGAAVRSGGIEAGLRSLGLDELVGKSPAEVIDRIADHIAEGADPTQYDLLSDALKNTILEAAALGEANGFNDLDSALQNFLERNGVEGLIQSYLGNYVYDRVWMAVENHAEMKAADSASVQAMSTAVGETCRSHVESLITEAKQAGRFDSTDWFGRAGTKLGNELIAELEGRLRGS